jgi:tetratricopeptide (TPR) repeat protein
MNDALIWLDSTYNFKTVDETSFLNGAFIYSELGYFDNAQDVLNTYSRIYDRKMHQFYYGLRRFADGDTTCFSLLKYFSEMVDSNAYYPEVKLAQQILNYKDGFTLNDYRVLVSMDVPDYYKVLIHARAVRQFPNNCEPFLLYGLYMNSIKNYGAAGQFLEEGDKCKLDPIQAETRMLNYGFALYMSGHADEALLVLKPLVTGTNAFMQQAALYFCAKVYMQQKNTADAKAYLQSIISATDKTKYEVLAQNLLLNIGN